jgi:hypothetical protein
VFGEYCSLPHGFGSFFFLSKIIGLSRTLLDFINGNISALRRMFKRNAAGRDTEF